MAAGWKKGRVPSPEGDPFVWTAELPEGLSGPEGDREWPFELRSPEGKHMHLSESEELNAFVMLVSPPVSGFYDMGYTDEDGDWWWVALRDRGGDLVLVTRTVGRQEASDRILRAMESGEWD